MEQHMEGEILNDHTDAMTINTSISIIHGAETMLLTKQTGIRGSDAFGASNAGGNSEETDTLKLVSFQIQ
jgi:hypothetical protein